MLGKIIQIVYRWEFKRDVVIAVEESVDAGYLDFLVAFEDRSLRISLLDLGRSQPLPFE